MQQSSSLPGVRSEASESLKTEDVRKPFCGPGGGRKMEQLIDNLIWAANQKPEFDHMTKAIQWEDGSRPVLFKPVTGLDQS